MRAEQQGETKQRTHQLFAESFVLGSVVPEEAGGRLQFVTTICFLHEKKKKKKKKNPTLSVELHDSKV